MSISASPRPVPSARIREVHRRLAATFGPLDPPQKRDPLEELILTVLSQNTNDVNRDRAFAAMRTRYPTWEALADASEHELEEAIRPGGLSKIKATRILVILGEIRTREGGSLDLSWMHAASTKRVAAYLLSLPGVGPKTVACVLAFSLERPALPVDTHVYRVAHRLGFLEPETDPTRAHAVLEKMVPPRLRVSMHVGMIRHGRATCRAGRPACERCPLQDLCPTAPLYLTAAKKRKKRRPGRTVPGRVVR